MTIQQSRREMLLDYIKNHEGCSKMDLEREMDGIASKVTIRKILDDLVKEDLIIPKKDKPNSQKYQLFINHENDFNKINESISSVQEMAEFIDKKRGRLYEKNLRDNKENKAKIDGIPTRNHEILRRCDQRMISLIHFLVYEIHSKIKLEAKSQMLYGRIIELMKQVHIEEEKEGLDNEISELQSIIKQISF